MLSIFAVWASALLGAGGPVTGVSITPAADQTAVLITIDGVGEFRDFTMEGPHRLVLDIFGSRLQLPEEDFLDIDRGGISSIRTSQYTPEIVRVVLELTSSLPYEVTAHETGLTILLANPTGAFEPWATPPSPTATSLSDVATIGPESPTEAPRFDLPGGGSPTQRVAPMSTPQQQAQRISVTFTDESITEVLFTFAEFSGRSIVAGAAVQGLVNATVDDQPWDVALSTILMVNGLQMTELESGIIRVDDIQSLNEMETYEPMRTEAYRISYATAVA